MNGFIAGGGDSPPLSFEGLKESDLETLLRQMKGRAFDVGIIRGIAKRCPWGKPQVIVCGPLKKGKPFPTTFWLTCPFLDFQCARLESDGAVAELEAILSEKAQEWARYHASAADFRMSLLSAREREALAAEGEPLRLALLQTGIGGIRPTNRSSAKCLHLQVATWFGLGFHPAEKWLLSKLESLHCGKTWLSRCGTGAVK
jgi:hypothetical protein